MKPLVQPQISINGRSRYQLIDEQLKVVRALVTALDAMNDATPHGRDYQHRPEEYSGAREAWFERIRVLGNLRDEIEAHALAIQDGE